MGLREDAVASEGRQDGLVARPRCVTALRSGGRRSALAWHTDVRRAWARAHGPVDRRFPMSAARRQELQRLKEPIKEQSLAVVVLGEAG